MTDDIHIEKLKLSQLAERNAQFIERLSSEFFAKLKLGNTADDAAILIRRELCPTLLDYGKVFQYGLGETDALAAQGFNTEFDCTLLYNHLLARFNQIVDQDTIVDTIWLLQKKVADLQDVLSDPTGVISRQVDTMSAMREELGRYKVLLEAKYNNPDALLAKHKAALEEQERTLTNKFKREVLALHEKMTLQIQKYLREIDELKADNTAATLRQRVSELTLQNVDLQRRNDAYQSLMAGMISNAEMLAKNAQNVESSLAGLNSYQ